jgi:hypothetical protein
MQRVKNCRALRAGFGEGRGSFMIERLTQTIKYRLALRRRLRGYANTLKSHESVKDFSRAEGEPNFERAMAKERNIQQEEVGLLMTRHLVYMARLHYIPIPEDDESWYRAKYQGGEKFLSPEAARKLHLEIRSEEKAEWDYWQSRVTFSLALIGSIFGVLAFFRK